MDTSATYFDGQAAAAHTVTVETTQSGLAFVLPSGTEISWPYNDLRLIDKPDIYGRFVLTSLSQREARLSISDDTWLAFLDTRAPDLRSNDVRARARGLWVIATATLVVSAAVAVVLWVPGLSIVIGRAIPPSWVEQIGEDVVAQFAAGERWCTGTGGTNAVAQMVRPLEEAGSPDFHLIVRVLDSDAINAFAAPGGRIVIFRGLIDAAESADEVAGVLAHEIAHVIHRHPTEATIRVLGSWIFFRAVLGDSAGSAGTLLIAFAHSRENEVQADRTALTLLRETGIGSQGMAAFFERLTDVEVESGADRIPSFLSTHPPTGERLRAIEAARVQPTAVRPALTAAEWKDLKAICDV